MVVFTGAKSDSFADLKHPGVDEFQGSMATQFEVVVFMVAAKSDSSETIKSASDPSAPRGSFCKWRVVLKLM